MIIIQGTFQVGNAIDGVFEKKVRMKLIVKFHLSGSKKREKSKSNLEN